MPKWLTSIGGSAAAAFAPGPVLVVLVVVAAVLVALLVGCVIAGLCSSTANDRLCKMLRAWKGEREPPPPLPPPPAGPSP